MIDTASANPYGGLWSGTSIVQAGAIEAKAQADAAAQQQKYKYYAIAGVVVLLIVGFFIYKYTRKQD